MLKMLGILLLSLAPILYGLSKSRQLQIQRSNFEGLMYLVESLRQGIGYQQKTVPQLLEEVSDEKYSIIRSIKSTQDAGDLSVTWDALSPSECPQAYTVMSQFFKALGTTDRDSQLSVCDMTLHRLEEIFKENEKDTQGKCKLYRSLGVLAGAFIAIILI